MMTLQDLEPKASAIVSGFQDDPELVGRLRELGLYPGAAVLAIGRAPFRGPRIFRVAGTVVALREEEAACVRIQLR